MFTKKSVFRFFILLFAILLISGTASASPLKALLGTGFTYQGRLLDGGMPANGTYDLQFKLFDTLTGGSQVGSTLTQSSVTVTNGLFTVQLDFGAVFNGTALYLEIGVRPGGSSGAYTTLTPRQPLSATPYALYTTQAGNAALLNNQPATYYQNASNINSGTLGANYFNAYAALGAEGYLNNAANALALNNGTLQSTLNADLLDGLHAASFALTGHNHWGETWTGSGTGLTLSGGTIGLSASGSTYGVFGDGGTSGTGIYGTTTNASGYGVFGTNTSAAGTGVYGSGSFYGVQGASTAAGGIGVSGISNGASSIGISGVSSAGSGVSGSGTVDGVKGDSADGNGVNGTSTNGAGTVGISTNGTGVFGMTSSSSGYGVGGTNTSSTGGTGVRGSGVTYGVLGDSTTGTGVRGTSSSGIGVDGIGGTGVSGSGSTYGVVGDGGTSGTGVYGTSSTTGGAGVSGTDSGTDGAGVYGSGNYYNGTGVYGLGNTGVVGMTTNSSGYGVWGFNNYGGTGVIGLGSTGVYGSGSTGVSGSGNTGVSGSGSTYGVEGTTTNGTGVFGTTTNSGGYGVSGTNTGTNGIGVSGSGDTYGVEGTTTNGTGVFGTTSSSSGYGVSGTNTGTTGTGVYGSGGTYGIDGESSAANGYGVYGHAYGGTGCCAGYFVGNIHVVGNISGTGTKSAVVNTQDYGTRTLYAVESPENWFQDFGTGQLTDGAAVITIDPVYAETVNLSDDYHVFFTPMGDCALYVTDKTPTSFTVKALGGQTCSIAFDYNIVAKRLGYEAVRLVVADSSPKAGAPSK